MILEYEIFEVLPNGSALRVTAVSGLEFAQLTLQELAKHTSNECFAADAKTRQVVAQVSVPQANWRASKRVFQITYDEPVGLRRAELLRSRGYGATSNGNLRSPRRSGGTETEANACNASLASMRFPAFLPGAFFPTV